LRFPDSYQQLRFVQGDVSGCAMDEQKYDVFFYPAEAIASGSMPVTPALAEASGAPAEGEARVFLKKARVVNVYYDKLSALYRSFRERHVTRVQALDEKQKLFDELQQQCAAIVPEPVSFNKCPAAMNNAGLAFDRTYTREYPRVLEGHYSVGDDPHVSLDRLKTFSSASPD